MIQKSNPSEEIEAFLNFIDQAKNMYTIAYDNVGMEDKRLQDLLHEMEFSENYKERNKAASKLQKKLKRFPMVFFTEGNIVSINAMI